MFFPFNPSKMSLYYHFSSIVSTEKSWCHPYLCVFYKCLFFHCQFKIVCLSLVLSNLITMSFDVAFMSLVLVVHWASRTSSFNFYQAWKVFPIKKNVFFFRSFPLRTPVICKSSCFKFYCFRIWFLCFLDNFYCYVFECIPLFFCSIYSGIHAIQCIFHLKFSFHIQSLVSSIYLLNLWTNGTVITVLNVLVSYFSHENSVIFKAYIYRFPKM